MLRFCTDIIDAKIRKKTTSQQDYKTTSGAYLDERIQKASVYFFDKLNDLESIGDLISETDNKAVNTAVKAVLDTIREILYVKTACLNLAKDGFILDKYLEMKNKKTVESENLKSVKLKAKDLDNEDKPLLNALLKWRKDKAKELVEKAKPRENQQIIKDFAEKPQKDKEKPPQGFYFLED